MANLLLHDKIGGVSKYDEHTRNWTKQKLRTSNMWYYWIDEGSSPIKGHATDAMTVSGQTLIFKKAFLGGIEYKILNLR